MKPRLILTLSLLLTLLAACAPQAAAPEVPAATQAPIDLPAVAATATPAQPAALEPSATQATVAEAMPMATSRGPELHATDPSTVSLATGGLHFVEFFRFT